ncbi:SHOCT domain-containing protein [Leucobacter manosquensis]|uniref:SHOCT domain-containing protein n=1 Tax=Leucobacter manosquensis TaxID=2810611 RepID=UPI003211B245
MSGAIARRQNERAVAAQANPVTVSSVPAPASAPTAAASLVGADLVAQLQQLASLQQQGVLSPEEFDRAKQQLLGP